MFVITSLLLLNSSLLIHVRIRQARLRRTNTIHGNCSKQMTTNLDWVGYLRVIYCLQQIESRNIQQQRLPVHRLMTITSLSLYSYQYNCSILRSLPLNSSWRLSLYIVFLTEIPRWDQRYFGQCDVLLKRNHSTLYSSALLLIGASNSEDQGGLEHSLHKVVCQSQYRMWLMINAYRPQREDCHLFDLFTA